jgi:hypothetical protein
MYDGNLRGILSTVLTSARKEVLTTESRSQPTQVRERLLVLVQRDPALILS